MSGCRDFKSIRYIPGNSFTLSTNINVDAVQEAGEQVNSAYRSNILSSCRDFKSIRNIPGNSFTLSTNINGDVVQEAGEQANSVLSSAASNSPRFPGHVYGGLEKNGFLGKLQRK